MGNLTHTVSGDIASFRSAARVPIENLKCHFLPKQDLHGYSKPWPGGGGKNLFNKDAAIQYGAYSTQGVYNGAIMRIITDYIPIEYNSVYTMKINNNIDNLAFANYYFFDDNLEYLGGRIENGDDSFSGLLEKTFTVNIMNTKYIRLVFRDATDATTSLLEKDLKKSNIQLELGTSATSYEPYENICPIEGWDSIIVHKAKKNLFNFDINNIEYNVPNQYGENRSIYHTGIISNGRKISASASPINSEVLSNTTINLGYLQNGTLYQITSLMVWDTGTGYSRTVSIPIGQELLLVNGENSAWGWTRNIPRYNIQIEINDSNTIFEPYYSEQIPITFPVLGKNKLNPAYRDDTYSNNIIYYRENRITLPAGTYTLSTSTSNVSLYVYQGHNGQQTTLFVQYNTSSLTFTLNKDTNDLWFNFYTGNGIDHTATCQLELNSSVTTYEPYNSDNTVYNGYVDITAGEIVATHKQQILNGTETWDMYRPSSGPSWHFWCTFNDKKVGLNGTISDTFPNANNTYFWDREDLPTRFGDHKTNHNLYFNAPYQMPNGVNEWKAWLAEHNVTIVYPLENPIHYPISKIELKTFLDQNNIWSNTNDITEVSYQIHDSNMIQQAKKNIMAENGMHYRKVLWNNIVDGNISDADWKSYNTNVVSVTFNNDIASCEILDTSKIRYSAGIVMKTYPPITKNNIYYASYMINPEYQGSFGIEYAAGQQLAGTDIQCQANVWTRRSFISNGRNDATGAMYIPFPAGYPEGITPRFQIKSPIYINLTAMFGLGNEPTKTEFEHLCEINNIDLAQAFPKDTGTEQIWCTPDHNIDNYTTIEWNQYAKPINENNYALHTASAASATFENGVATRTITTETTGNNCYITVFRSNYTFPAVQDHIYYAKEELNSEVDKNYVISYANNWHVKTIIPNQWSIIEDIFTHNSTGNKYIYLCYRSGASDIGETCSTRNPIFIDLTQMFGAGNEPTTPETLRAMCLKNNINLDEPQPYNTGTKMIWKV